MDHHIKECNLVKFIKASTRAIIKIWKKIKLHLGCGTNYKEDMLMLIPALLSVKTSYGIWIRPPGTIQG